MTLQQQLIKEIEELPRDAQEKILKLVHFFKKEILTAHKKKSVHKKTIDLSEIDKMAIDTGITDLAEQHDHYLLATDKR